MFRNKSHPQFFSKIFPDTAHRSGISLALVLLLILTFTSACQQAPAMTMLPETSHILEGDAVVWIDITRGDVAIQFGDFDAVSIHGQIDERYLKHWQIFPTEHGLTIKLDLPNQNLFNRSQTVLDLVVSIPVTHEVNIDTFNASFTIFGSGGALDLSSMGGAVLVENFTGDAVIKANRGDVTVMNSRGSIAVFANYGLINLVDVSGAISAVNILGKIRYNGTPTIGDQIRLETDHGSVDFAISGEADLQYQLQSTSGEVTCLLPNANRTVRLCQGEIGTGNGQLFIKTVSGGIKLHLFPYHGW
jgi:hypothetical protein